MEVHIYSSIKAIVATDIVNRYSDDTKRPKLKENQLGILKIYTFCQKKISRGPRAQERVLLGCVSIYENTPKKLLHFPPKS